jgi:hypothetical protein
VQLRVEVFLCDQHRDWGGEPGDLCSVMGEVITSVHSAV